MLGLRLTGTVTVGMAVVASLGTWLLWPDTRPSVRTTRSGGWDTRTRTVARSRARIVRRWARIVGGRGALGEAGQGVGGVAEEEEEEEL